MTISSAPLTVSAALSLGTAVLGLFMALPLMALGRRRRSNVWLGLFVLSLTLLCFADFCGASGMYRDTPALRGVFDWPLAAIGTFFYCYVRSMLGLGNGQRQLWLFLPLVVWIGMLLAARFRGPLGIPVAPILLAFQLQACGCALAVLYRLHQYRQRLRAHFSSTRQRDLAWLGWLTGLLLALLCVWIPAALMNGVWDWLLLLGRLGVLYFVGWFGMRQAEIFQPPAMAAVQAAPATVIEELGEQQKYARSGMTEAAANLIGERLSLRSTRDRDYLDSDLKLVDLAQRIGTSPQLLSQYLNDALSMNFFDYINSLRIAEFQRLLRDATHHPRPLQDLALEAGFNSRSTFYSAFKKACGMTPAEWRKQHVSMSVPVGLDKKFPSNPDTGGEQTPSRPPLSSGVS